jgi:cell division protein FtsL
LTRLIAGKAWIAVVAFALIGIVTLQLGLLKLNGGIGRALEHEAVLQRENAALSIENSELAAGTRVQARAAQLGMAFVPSAQLRFLSAPSRGDLTKAATALSSATPPASAEGGEVSAGSSEPEASQGAGAPASTEGAGTEAGSSEATGESEATAPQSSESSSSESSSSESSAGGGSGSAATSEAESSSSASAETGPAGGIQASAPGG